jgi:hypothetical protein
MELNMTILTKRSTMLRWKKMREIGWSKEDLQIIKTNFDRNLKKDSLKTQKAVKVEWVKE